jgi:peroxiredoxin
MKRIFLQLCVVALIVSFLFSTSCSKKNDPLVQDTQGASFRLSQMHGKWIIINFWADWCDACREEIPEFNKYFARIKNSNVMLFGINYDGVTGAELTASMKKMGIQYPNLTTNPGWAWGLTDVTVLPTTFIISPKGQVIKRFVGGTTQKNLEDTLAMLQKTF